MKAVFVVAAMAVLAFAAADAASARVKKQSQQSSCVQQPIRMWNFWPGRDYPQPNGCAPPVYQHGRYVGQDPDPNIQFQLMRDPATGYGAGQY